MSSRRLAPVSATRLSPACRRSWKWTQVGSGDRRNPDPVAERGVTEQVALRAGEEQAVKPGQSVLGQMADDGREYRCRNDDDTAAGRSLGW
jgi:hypothetical protein